MTELADHIAEIQEMFEGHLKLTEDQIRAEFDNLLNYDVPVDQARETIVNTFADQEDIDSDLLFQTSDSANETDIAAMDSDGEWGSYRLTVSELWTPTADSIAQVGLVADETGQTKFTKWARADHLPELEEGESYRVEDAVTDEYNGDYSLSFNSSTTITSLDSDIDPSSTVEVRGAIIDLQSGSGLIQRCPYEDCTYVVGDNGQCAEHGSVEGEHDIRLKAIVDDGEETYNVVFRTGATAALTAISLDDAIEIADSETNAAVTNRMKAEFIGRYFSITGTGGGAYIDVEGFQQVTEPHTIETTLRRAQTY